MKHAPGRLADDGAENTVFGRLEQEGKVRAIFCRRPSPSSEPHPLSAEQADALAAHLAGLGRLYQRIGYVPVTDFAVYDFSCGITEAFASPLPGLRRCRSARRPDLLL